MACMSGTRLLTAIVWLLPGLVTLGLSEFLSVSFQLSFFGVFSIAFGLWAFFVHGGPQLTAAGVFSGASGVFIGYASLWWNDYLVSEVPVELLIVTVACYFVTVLMYTFFWWDTRHPLETESRDPKTARWASVTGILLTTAALISHTVLPDSFHIYASTIAFVGIATASLGLIGSRNTGRALGFPGLILAALVFWYIVVAFGGFGRLKIISLLATVGIALSTRQTTRSLKVITLAAVPLASVGLTSLRFYLSGSSPSPLTETEDSPDSDVSGIWTFARLIASEDMTPAWGETFWATMTIWIPRAWWPDKPYGLGAEITALLEPHLVSSWHSMVATTYGEWYWNFGWWGLLLMIPIVGWGVKWLDRHRTILGTALSSRRAILTAVLLMMAIATLPDFVWSGTHTYAGRMLFRSIVVLGLLLLFATPLRTSAKTRQVTSTDSPIQDK